MKIFFITFIRYISNTNLFFNIDYVIYRESFLFCCILNQKF